MTARVFVAASLDSQGREAAFLAGCLRASGLPCALADVGLSGPASVPAEVSRETIAACHPDGGPAVLANPDAEDSRAAMSLALSHFLRREQAAERVAGVLGLEGSPDSVRIAPALAVLPIGLPKLLIASLASGDLPAGVTTSDLVLVPVVVEDAGLNIVTRVILNNAANALAGMVIQRGPSPRTRLPVGLTVAPETAPAAAAVRTLLEVQGLECLAFSAPGTGVQTLDRLIASGLIRGVIDLTIPEVAGVVVAGATPASQRFEAVLDARIPFVLCPGALDRIPFGSREQIPERFRNRLWHAPNPRTTWVRSSPEENRLAARWIAEKLRGSSGPWRVVIPEAGLSALDAPGQAFHDPEAMRALVEEFDRLLASSPDRRLIRLPYHINDRAFAEALAAAFWDLVEIARSSD